MKNEYDLETFDSATPYKIQMIQIKKFNLHWHNYIEIFYVKKGSIRLQTDDFSFHLDEGHICFINSNTIHSVHHTDIENEILILQIPTETQRPFYTLRNYKFNSSAYLADFSQERVPLKELQSILDNIYREHIIKSAGYNQIILGYINTLLGLLIRKYYLIPKTDNDYTAEKNLSRLSDIITYLDEHYTEKVSLQTIADELHINYYYLSHFFKDTAGISFQDYLNNLRVDKSLSLLAEADKNITDIALDSGFPNIKSYTKAFKEKFGMLPSKYKKIITQDTEKNFVDDEQLFHSYPKQFQNSISFSEPLHLYRRLNLTPKEYRYFSENYYIPDNQALPESKILSNDYLTIEKNLFLSIGTVELQKILQDFSIQEILVISNEFSEEEKNIIYEKAALLNLNKVSFEDKNLDDIMIHNDYIFPLMYFSMINALSYTLKYLNAPRQIPTPTLSRNPCQNLMSPFTGSSSYLTTFGAFTPLFYAEKFIRKIRGSLIFHSDSCAVFRHNHSYQILCCHKKSLQMYQSLSEPSTFQESDYLFFINSFPHMKYSFTFKSITTKVKQTTYILSEKHGSIFSQWYNLGAPAYLNKFLADYLIDITKPSIHIFSPVFREKPIISVELPPLAIAYIELEAI